MTPEQETTTTTTTETNPNAATTTTAPKEEMVSKADLERALADLHKYKSKAKTYEEKIEQEKTARMKEQNQWKELAEQREKEAAEAKAETQKIQGSFLGERKFNAVREKCAALGLRPEAMSDLEMLDLSQVQIETTSTGKINVLGADKFSERLKALKPHWFADKQPPNVNSGGPRIDDTDGTITTDMILAAEAEARKTGDSTKYHNLFSKYQTQRSAQKR